MVYGWETWVLCTDPQMSKSVIPNYDAYRKATAEEILKHSKALFSRQHSTSGACKDQSRIK